jgi:hypothetical protein
MGHLPLAEGGSVMTWNMMWIVMCRVSDGQGSREEPLKSNRRSASGGLMAQYFATEAEAKAKAAELTKQMNRLSSGAKFTYWAEEA